METQIEVNTANREHADGISKVICEAIRRLNAKDYPLAEIDRLVGDFTTSRNLEFLELPLTLIAMSGGEFVGTGSLQGSELKSVFISPDLHRRGIRRILV